MKNFRLIIPLVLFSTAAAAQLSGTYNVPVNYTTVASAIAALNASGISGPVTIEVAAGHTENAPLGGLTLTATGTSANPIIFQKVGTGPNPLITSYNGGTGTPGTAVQDGVWKLVGCDYITIDGISISDPNISNPATMEYGFGFFKASATDGCNNNTIKNCVITLNRINNAAATSPAVEGSRGINVMNALVTSQNVNLTVTSVSGSNSNNKFYSNTIQNCNIGIALIGFADVSPFSYADTGNEIGGNSLLTGNTIINFGGGGTTSAAAGIRTLAQYSINVAYNIINNNNGLGVNHAAIIRGIYLNTAAGANASVVNNTLTIKNGGTTTQVSVIENVSGSAGTGNTITLSNNLIADCTGSLTTTGAYNGIYNTATPANLFITGNTFTNNITNATSGTSYLVRNTGAVSSVITITSNILGHSLTGAAPSTGALYSIYNTGSTLTTTLSVSSNSFTSYNHTNATGTGILYFIYNTGDCAFFSITGNNWNNLSLNQSGAQYYMYNTSSTQSVLTVANNTITNISRNAAAGSIYCYYATATSPGSCVQTFSGNIISNITATVSGTGTFYGIYSTEGNTSPYPKKLVNHNLINNINMSGTGTFYGIYMTDLGDAGTTSGSSVNNNTITSVTFNDIIYGLYMATPTSPSYPANVFSNVVGDLTSNGATSTVYGSLVGSSNAGINYFRNKIYNLTANGGTGVAHGIWAVASPSTNIFNNYIGGISTPSSTGTNKSNGIFVNAGTNINIWYNTVLLNAVSTGANFGSNAIYISATPTVTLRNNIFINNSVPTGQGVAAAYKRSAVNLSTYNVTSDNNIFYAGTPASDHLLFDDGTNVAQTLAALKSLVTPRETSSFTENTAFLSTTGSAASFLHVNPTLFSLTNSGALNLPGIMNDFDGDIRQGNPGYTGQGTAPDIGADEYDQNLPACTAANSGTITASASQKCAGQTISLVSNGFSTGSGTTYQWKVGTSPGGPYTNVTGGTGSGNIAFISATLSPGIYYYVLSTTCSNGSLTGFSNQATVNVYAVPGATASAITGTVCEDASIVLSGTTNIGTGFSWSGPGGYTTTAQNPTITNASVLNAGAYTLVALANGCSSAPSTVSVTVSGTTLNVQAVPPSHCNSGTSTISVMASSALSYTWNTSSTSSAIIVSPTATTIYTLSGINNDGCIKNVTTTVTVISPTITSNGGFICGAAGGNGTLSVVAFSPSMVNWYASSGSTVPIGTGTAYPLASPVTTTLYAQASSVSTGSLFTTLAAGNSFLGNMFDVNALSNIEVNGFDIHVSSAIVYTVEVWYRQGSFAGFSTSSAGWTLAGTTTVTGTGTGTLTPVPMNFTVPVPMGQTCAFYVTITSGTMHYTNAGTVGTVWASNSDLEMLVGNGGGYFAVGNASRGFNGVIRYSKPGCISPVIPVVYTVQPNPVISANAAPTSICSGSYAILSAIGALNYTWSTGAGNTVTVSPLSSSIYTVIGADHLGCSDTTTVSLNVRPTPSLIITQTSPSVCIGGSVLITVSGADQYLWDSGAITSTISVTPVSATVYSVSGTSTNNCAASATASVISYSLPAISVSQAEYTMCLNEEATFHALGGLTYTWVPGNIKSDTIRIVITGTSVFTVTGSDGHCLNIATVTVTSDECVGLKLPLTEKDYMICPNPSHGIFKITFKGPGLKRITIANVTGVTVNKLNTVNFDEQIDLGTFPRGVYIITVETDEGRHAQRVILH